MKSIPANEDLFVYFAQCPKHGPVHRFYSSDDIQRAGGRHLLEQSIANESLWFVYVGSVVAHESEDPRLGSLVLHRNDLVHLPSVRTLCKQPGRLNPAYTQEKICLQLFESIFDSISTFVQTWNHVDYAGFLEGYALKDVRIDSTHLRHIAHAAVECSNGSAVVEASIIEYWDDTRSTESLIGTALADPTPILSDDIVLRDFSRWFLTESRWERSENQFTTRATYRNRSTPPRRKCTG